MGLWLGPELLRSESRTSSVHRAASGWPDSPIPLDRNYKLSQVLDSFHSKECLVARACSGARRVYVSYSVMSDSLRSHGQDPLPGSSVHGILQARILEWVAISFPKDLDYPRSE